MWKIRGKLIYSAEYDRNSKTVKVRDWRGEDERVSSCKRK
jgi:hypothetical protein